MKIIEKVPAGEYSAKIVYPNDVDGEDANYTRDCIIGGHYWTYDHCRKAPVVYRMKGGGWVLDVTDPPGPRYPSRLVALAVAKLEGRWRT